MSAQPEKYGAMLTVNASDEVSILVHFASKAVSCDSSEKARIFAAEITKGDWNATERELLAALRDVVERLALAFDRMTAPAVDH